jgi:two-component system, NarL family, response regulator NreC
MIHVFMIDDHPLLRSGIKLLLQTQGQIEVVGEADDGPSALEKLPGVQADVITLDLGLRGESGLELIPKLAQISQARVLVVTMYDDPAYMRTARAMGAAGYITKNVADTRLIEAIHEVHRGERVFPEVITVPAVPGESPKPAKLQSLSGRERSVLGLIAAGHTNQVVADRLGVSVKSIESYRARIMTKLALETRADLVRVAIETGYLKPAHADQQLPSNVAPA